MQAITLYHDPQQGMLHTLTFQVWQDGTHKVIDSSVSSVPRFFDLSKLAEGYAACIGHDKVRAYTISLER